MSILLQLALSFGMLSILAVGGGTAVLPEMQTVLAEQFNIDHTAFVHIYSIGLSACRFTWCGRRAPRVFYPVQFALLRDRTAVAKNW